MIARQRSCADSTSLNTITGAAAGLPAPRVTLVLDFTVLKVLSTGFVVCRLPPALGGEVVECEELVGLVGDLLGRFRLLRSIGALEVLDCLLSVAAVLGVADLLQGLLRAGLSRLR